MTHYHEACRLARQLFRFSPVTLNTLPFTMAMRPRCGDGSTTHCLRAAQPPYHFALFFVFLIFVRKFLAAYPIERQGIRSSNLAVRLFKKKKSWLDLHLSQIDQGVFHAFLACHKAETRLCWDFRRWLNLLSK